VRIRVIRTNKKSVLNPIGIKVYFDSIEIHHGYFGVLIFLAGLLLNHIILTYVGLILVIDDLAFHIMEKIRG